jgi:formate-dependent nitrite reductase membrane component NrfD
MTKLKYLPIALYLYIFGAAGIGFSLAMGMTATPNVRTLIVSGISCVMALVGHFMMRPYVRMARGEMKGQSRDQLAPEAAAK